MRRDVKQDKKGRWYRKKRTRAIIYERPERLYTKEVPDA